MAATDVVKQQTFQDIHVWNQGGIISAWLSSYLPYNYDISFLQFLFCKNTPNLKETAAAYPLKILGHCKRPSDDTTEMYGKIAPLK